MLYPARGAYNTLPDSQLDFMGSSPKECEGKGKEKRRESEGKGGEEM